MTAQHVASPVSNARCSKGMVAYLSGLAAEDQVLRSYLARGIQLVDARWRGTYGEIDLVLKDRDELVFVEVKRAKTFVAAAARVTPAQQRRLYRTVQEYLAQSELGFETSVRFDVALVDQSGKIDILENIFLEF